MPAKIYRIAPVVYPDLFTWSRAELQAMRAAHDVLRKRPLVPMTDVLCSIERGCRYNRRYSAFRALEHPLSRHALARSEADPRLKAAEADDKLVLEEFAFIDCRIAFDASLRSNNITSFIKILRECHTRLIQEEASYRCGPVGTLPDSCGGGRIFPDAILIAPQLCLLYNFLHSSRSWDPVVRATVAHVAISSLHPFMDGNGRLARLVFNCVVYADAVESTYIPLRQLFNAAQHGYEIRLRQIDQGADWRTIVLFFCDVINAYDAVCVKALRQPRLVKMS